MDETQILNNLSIMLIAVINLGGIARIIYCLIQSNSDDNQRPMKQRIKNIVIFLIVANSIFSIVAIFKTYYGG